MISLSIVQRFKSTHIVSHAAYFVLPLHCLTPWSAGRSVDSRDRRERSRSPRRRRSYSRSRSPRRDRYRDSYRDRDYDRRDRGGTSFLLFFCPPSNLSMPKRNAEARFGPFVLA